MIITEQLAVTLLTHMIRLSDELDEARRAAGHKEGEGLKSGGLLDVVSIIEQLAEALDKLCTIAVDEGHGDDEADSGCKVCLACTQARKTLVAYEASKASAAIHYAECSPNCDDPECPYTHFDEEITPAQGQDIERLTRERDEARRVMKSECIAACQRVMQEFFSPEYMSNQPLSSHQERLGCRACIEAIRAISTGGV